MRILDGVERLRAGLDYHLARHNVLTANLAQVDTPGFQPLDLARNTPATHGVGAAVGPNGASFGEVLATTMIATDPAHVGSSHGGPAPGEIIVDRGASPGLDGNAVSIEREAVKIASNQLRYDLLSTVTATTLADLMWAANDGRAG
jgi:flagellar basal-body rod protein FlgB